MIIAAAAAAAGGAAAANAMRQEEEAVSGAQGSAQMAAGASIYSHIKGNLPPLSGDPDKAMERAKQMNRPEVLLQDPMCHAIVCIIRHLASPEPIEATSKKSFLATVLGPDEPEPKYAPIKGILRFFPALEHDQILARLRVLEQARLIHYWASGYEHPVYSPRVWTGECKGNGDLGFRLNQEVVDWLDKQAAPAPDSGGVIQ